MGIVGGMYAFGLAMFCIEGDGPGTAQSRLLLERRREEGNIFLTSMSGLWSDRDVARVRQRLI